MRIRLMFTALALAIASSLNAFPASAAAAGHVEDGAGMFSADAIARVNTLDDQLVRRTGKTVTVVTVKSTNGTPVQELATREAKAHGLNGAIIYIGRDDKQISIEYGAKTSELFPPALQTSIKQALRAAFRAGDYDNGLVTAVGAIAEVIEAGASGGHGPAPQQVMADQQRSPGGSDLSWIFWVIGGIVVILIVRALLVRRAPPPAYPPGAVQPGQPGYEPPGSGGSGFLPSLLGGVAGGFIGSELANAGRRDDDSASAAPSEPSSDASSSGAGGGFSDSGGGGDFGGGGGDSGW